MTEKKYAFDIFKILEKLNLKDRKFFNDLSDEELKALQPLVLMRWMSGVAEARQVYFLNELVNPMVFPLTKHKRLLLDLLMISGPGHNRRYTWTKAKGKTLSNTPKALALVKEEYGLSTSHALDALKILTNADILQLAQEMGKQPDEVREISKEIKGRGIVVE